MLRGFLIAGAIAVGAVATVAVLSDGEPVTVIRVIDGDTFTANVGGEEKRVRLLNVDTPELGRDGSPDECLAQEAADFLSALLPAGQKIDVEYDVEKQDRYDRELLGVFLDGQLVNAEIARQGLGVALQFGDNGKFHPDVSRAEDEARTAGIGVHGLPEECSVPQQTDSTMAQVTALLAVSVVGMDQAALDLHEDKVLALISEVRDLRNRADDPTEFAQAAYEGYRKERGKLDSAISDLVKRGDGIDERYAQIQKEEETERHRLEAERLESERRAAEEAATAERQRQEAEERERLASATQVPASPAPRQVAPQQSAPQQSAPSGGPDTYTGCRAYGGNYALTSIDDKGRNYAKIDCTTKVQIG